jgi:aldose 1-epimerase
MSFQIEKVNRNGIDLVLLKDNLLGCFISIAPAHGALLHEFVVNTNNGPINVIDNYPTIEELKKEIGTSYKSSKLSPFPCRIKDGKYWYEGEEFEFPNKFGDGNAIHGLLYNKPFGIADEFADDREASIALKYNYKEEDDGFPFSYRCEIRYTLLPEQVLQIQTTILNLDDLPIPMADGWHPYFSLEGPINNYLLCFQSKGMLEFDAKLVPTGRVLPYDTFNTEKIIGNSQLDNCFLLNENRPHAACTLFNPANRLEISFFPDASYPYLQLYTPDHRKSIAIENLSGAPDCFNNKMGLVLLPSRQSHTFTLYYKLSFRKQV